MPAVSVIVPAYNGGPLLRRCVEAVLGQDFADLDCVVVDDGGTDDLSWLRDLDPRVRLVRQANAGVSVARNNGVAVARSDRIAFCDQDDEWLPGKVSAQLASWRADTVVSLTDFSWHFPDGRVEVGVQSLDGLAWPSMLASGHFCLSSLLVARSAFTAVGGFNPLLAMEQDWFLLALLLRQFPNRLCLVPQTLVRYYLHDANASRDYHRAYRERDAMLAQFAATGDAAVLAACRQGRRLNRTLRAAQAVEAARQARTAGDWRRGALDLGRAARWRPGPTARAIAATLH